MKKIIVITSGKGGVGKTTTAINLGAAINHFGKDVLVKKVFFLEFYGNVFRYLRSSFLYHSIHCLNF